MACAECARLLGEIRRTESALATALRTLHSGLGRLPEASYARLKAAIDQARLDFEQHEQRHIGTGSALW